MWTVFLLLLLPVLSFSSPHKDRLKVSKLSLSFNPLRPNGLNISEYNRALKRVRTVYDPIFKKLRMKWKITSDWSDVEENAYAEKLSDGTRAIVISGGYARVRFMTPDAFLTIICHEIGHHLGGAPRKTVGNLWASTEGEADYYSTLKCMKLLLAGDTNNEMVTRALSIPVRHRIACQGQYRSNEDIQICYRSLQASQDYGQMLEGSRVIKLSTPDLSHVLTTQEQHPKPQCRIDTKASGALCNADPNEQMDGVDEVQGSCHSRNGHRVGLRPECWYKSKI